MADEIYPLHFFDDIPLFRRFAMNVLFAYDSVLDPKKLYDSLTALASVEGWRKIGARLRLNDKGFLEYHVPQSFTDKRPAILFRHSQHRMPISNHPQASKLPKTTQTPIVQESNDLFDGLAFHADSPRSLNDYISADISQLGLYVVSFDDATLVTLAFPHTLCDMVGFGTLLKGWQASLNGRINEAPRLHGVDVDPLRTFGCHPKEKYRLGGQKLSNRTIITQYVMRNLTGICLGTKTNTVCIPATHIASLRENLIQELRDMDPTTATPFLSEGDTLCAWWSRIVLRQSNPNINATLVVNNAQSLRKPLRDDYLPTEKEYFSNAFGVITSLIPIKTVLEKSLSLTASHLRRSIAELGTRGQAEAYASFIRQSPSKMSPAFGTESCYILSYSNFTQAKLLELDLGAATIGCDKGDSQEARIKPRCAQFWEGTKFPSSFFVLGKDEYGNYWIAGNLRKSMWRKIARSLEKEVTLPKEA